MYHTGSESTDSVRKASRRARSFGARGVTKVSRPFDPSPPRGKRRAQGCSSVSRPMALARAGGFTGSNRSAGASITGL
eukprot:705753-Prorocentrum_minimum.AAC.2